MANNLKPGDPAPSVGTYIVVDSHGNNTTETVHIRHIGRPMPPTHRPNETYRKK